MSFGQLNTYALPCVYDYDDALKEWEKLIKTRDDPGKRWLVHNHRDKWAVKYTNGDIGFMYRGHELVRYNKDNTITLEPHGGTRSYTDFANRILPPGFIVDWYTSGAPWVAFSGYTENGYNPRFWFCPKQVTLKRQGANGPWQPTKGNEPFSVAKLDLKRLNAALRARGGQEFEAWARALVALDGWRRVNGLGDPRMTTCMAMMGVETESGRQHILAALASPLRWEEILCSPPVTSYAHDADKALKLAIQAVRKAIIAEDMCIKITKVKHLDGDKAFNAYKSARSRFKSAIRKVSDVKNRSRHDLER